MPGACPEPDPVLGAEGTGVDETNGPCAEGWKSVQKEEAPDPWAQVGPAGLPHHEVTGLPSVRCKFLLGRGSEITRASWLQRPLRALAWNSYCCGLCLGAIFHSLTASTRTGQNSTADSSFPSSSFIYLSMY